MNDTANRDYIEKIVELWQAGRIDEARILLSGSPEFAVATMLKIQESTSRTRQ